MNIGEKVLNLIMYNKKYIPSPEGLIPGTQGNFTIENQLIYSIT